MIRKTFLAGLAALLLCSSANASIILGLLKDPASTSGVPLSTRSGPGTWQLYAIEDAAENDLGIASYNVTMTGQTAINHRSPVGSANDSNGDPQGWGFNLFRSGTNVSPLVAAQPLEGTTPFILTGLGRTASSASAQILAAQPTASGIAATTGGSWGAYNSPVLNNASQLSNSQNNAPDAAAAVTAGRKWLFLAEGTGVPNITSAAFTVLTTAAGATGAGQLGTIRPLVEVPEPATISLIGLALVGGFGFIRRRS